MNDFPHQNAEPCENLLGEDSHEMAVCNDFACPSNCLVSGEDESLEIDCSNGGHHILPFKLDGSSGKNIWLNEYGSLSLKKIASWKFDNNSLSDECWDDIVAIVDRSSRLRQIGFDDNEFVSIPKQLFQALKKVCYH